MRRFLRGTLVALAIAYPLALIAVWLGLALVGETWWPTTVALYLPRLAFAAPLPLLVLALLVWGPRWLLAGQLVAAGVLLFPLLGLELGGPVEPSGRPRLRVLSYNVNYGYMSNARILADITGAGADVIVLQASHHRLHPALDAALASYQRYHHREFYVASRFPIVSVHEPDGFHPAFVRVTLATPLGPIDVFDIHPLSPRPGLDALRGDGLRESISDGRVLRGEGSDRVLKNTDLRARQVAGVAALAAASTNPVIIAGDTNLPALSPLYREHLGRWQDGFEEVGRGFGYTFPAHKWIPWMRIDRILAGPELRFLRFGVTPASGASDHLAVWADLELR